MFFLFRYYLYLIYENIEQDVAAVGTEPSEKVWNILKTPGAMILYGKVVDILNHTEYEYIFFKYIYYNTYFKQQNIKRTLFQRFFKLLEEFFHTMYISKNWILL